MDTDNPYTEFELTVLTGLARGTAWPLGEVPLTLGRGIACDISIPESDVSRTHCQVWASGSSAYLRDLGSSNGTVVNGQPVRETGLKPGDEILLGSCTLLLTRVAKGSEPQEPAASQNTPLTLALSDAMYIRKDPGYAEPHPSHSFDDLRQLFLLTNRFNSSATLSELEEALSEVLKQRFEPEGLWLGRYLLPQGELIFDPIEGAGSPDRAPLDTLRKAIDENVGLLMPKRVREGGQARVEVTLVAPLAMGNERIGVVAVQSARRLYGEPELQFLVALAHAFAPCLRAVERNEQLRRDLRLLKGGSVSTGRLLGGSAIIRKTLQLASQAARTELPVLLLGETGTGKELAARLIHDLSSRSKGPFVVINCAAIPRDLFESEIFGHERGAFTSAVRRRIGRFEEAHGGTLFLDEVGELTLENQARLLRVLETGTFYRVGGEREIHASVRVVAATNRSLTERVTSRNFREDLYHRLCGFEIHLPPLRERLSDVPILAQHFLDTLNAQGGCMASRIAPEALARLTDWHWPGNVRELKACIERAAALAQTATLRADDIFLVATACPLPAPAVPSTPMALADMEREHIVRMLRQHGGNIRATAQALGISRPRLYRKMLEYGLKA